MKVCLSKIDNRLINLVQPRIVMDYGGHATLVDAFTVVEQYDRVLYQHDDTDLISLLVYYSKSHKFLIMTTRLAEADDDKTLYYWPCG